jgi:excisionase family DNA binding protein
MQDTTKLAYSIQEAASALSISPWTVRARIRSGAISPTHIGTRVIIETSELLRFLSAGRASQPQAEDAK